MRSSLKALSLVLSKDAAFFLFFFISEVKLVTQDSKSSNVSLDYPSGNVLSSILHFLSSVGTSQIFCWHESQ